MAYDDEDDFSEFPDLEDLREPDDAENEVLDPCPRCKRLMYDDAERCPHCGEYVSPGQGNGVNPRWVLLTAAVCVIVTVYLIFH